MNKPIIERIKLFSNYSWGITPPNIVFTIYRDKFLGVDVGIKIKVENCGGVRWRTIDFDENQYAEIELTSILEKHD